MATPNGSGGISLFPNSSNLLFENCSFEARSVGPDSLSAQEIVKSRQLALLSSIPRAHYAAFDALRTDRAKSCLQGTRQTVLAAIDTWAKHPDPGHPPIFWLTGLAGIGKTTIAHTVASSLDKRAQLGGSFFFLRSDDQLKDARLVLPTLAWQLSNVDHLVKARLVEVLEENLACVNQEIAGQFNYLILDPLSATSRHEPLVIVLDALDECQPDDITADILQVLIDNVRKIPFLRILITSRPEAHIRKALGIVKDGWVHQKLVLHENVELQEEVERDIRLYLRRNLQEVWDRDPSRSGAWPPEGDLEVLVQQSAKLFIYATTAVRFIGGSSALDIRRQLSILLELKNHTYTDDDPYRHLDQLYLAILDSAFDPLGMTARYYVQRFKRIVGSIVLMHKSLPIESLANFIGDYDIATLKQTLHSLHSIFIVPEDPLLVVQTYHLSFRNFITDSERCKNRNLFIHSPSQELYLFLRCFEIMKASFVPHSSSVPQRQFYVPRTSGRNIETGDSAAALIEKMNNARDVYEGDASITPEARYSRNHWCAHLLNIRLRLDSSKKSERVISRTLSPTLSSRLIDALQIFVFHYLPKWLSDRISRIEQGEQFDPITESRLARDTFEIMDNTHRWMVANNINPNLVQEVQRLMAENKTWLSGEIAYSERQIFKLMMKR